MGQAVAGLRGTGDWGADERPKNFREMIQFRQPNGGTPLLGLMAKTKKESVDDAEFNWWDESVDIVRLQVNGALGSGDTTVTVDSADPDATNPERVYGVAQHLKPGDMLMVEPATDNATFNPEYIEVTAVLSDTQFTVRRGVAGSSAAAIGDNIFLLLIGSVFAEGTAEPKSATRNPVKYKNYTQIFKDSYEVTGTAAGTKLRTGDPLKNERKRKSFDHARGMEFAFLFGRDSETAASVENGKPKRTTRGLRRSISAQNVTVFTAAVTFTAATNNFLDAVYKVFDFETEAGDERIVFAGNGALNELNKIIAKDTNTQVQYGGVIKTYGMNLREVILPQGRLLVRTHPLLNRHSLYTKSMWLLDFSAIKYRYFKGRDTKFTDNIQQKGEDAIRGFWQTECGFQLNYGGLTCGYLGNISAT